MDILFSTLNQMGFLFLFIAIGFVMAKTKVLAIDGAKLLAKLESVIFIPALILDTFISQCTLEKLKSLWIYFVCGLGFILICIPLARFLARFCAKDAFLKNIYTYGLCFSNFGYMGNAVVQAIFPEIFVEYLMFTLPFQCMIYVWAVPALLLPHGEGKLTLKDRVKSLKNPMFFAVASGIVLGLLNAQSFLPQFVLNVVKTSGNCMSPIAMLLTGIMVASAPIGKILKQKSVYFATFLRLLAIPAVLIAILAFIPFDASYHTLLICAVASVAMPLGMNTIIIPAAYGKDTTEAVGLTMVSHVLSVATIPLVFYFMNLFLLG